MNMTQGLFQQKGGPKYMHIAVTANLSFERDGAKARRPSTLR